MAKSLKFISEDFHSAEASTKAGLKKQWKDNWSDGSAPKLLTIDASDAEIEIQDGKAKMAPLKAKFEGGLRGLFTVFMRKEPGGWRIIDSSVEILETPEGQRVEVGAITDFSTADDSAPVDDLDDLPEIAEPFGPQESIPVSQY